MNVLIAGGNGFIGSKLVDKLHNEGHHIIVVDITEGAKNIRKMSAGEFYKMDILSNEMDGVFRSVKFDLVIHLAQSYAKELHEECIQEFFQKTIAGTLSLINLSAKHHVKKFVYISSNISEYGNEGFESQKFLNFDSLFRISKKSCEDICLKASNMNGMKSLVLRMPMLFGPGMNEFSENVEVYKFIEAVLSDNKGETVTLRENFELLYICDAVNLLHQMILNEKYEGLYKIAAPTVSADKLINIVNEEYPISQLKIQKKQVQVNEDKYDSIVPRVVESEDSSHELEKSIKSTIFAISNDVSTKSKREATNSVKVKFKLLKPDLFKPLFENLMGGAIAFTATSVSGSFFDVNLAYIMYIGIRYGLKHALFAAVFGALLKLIFMNDITNILVMSFLQMIISYLLIAFISSYVIDKKNHEVKKSKEKFLALNNKYKSMITALEESREAYHTLNEHIKITDNGFARVHKATRRLDSFNIKKLYSEMINVVEEITDFQKVKLYTINRKTWNMELFNKDNNENEFDNTSINIDDFEIYRTMLFKPNVFLNTRMNQELPSAVLPIMDENINRVEAMLVIEDIPFESYNVFTEYLLGLTTELISKAISRAKKYENLNDEEINNEYAS